MKKTLFTQENLKAVAILFVIITLITIMPAYAAGDWASKTNTVVENLISGLTILGRGVATVAILWTAICLIFGMKSLRDLMPWLIGALIFASVTEIVNLFFS